MLDEALDEPYLTTTTGKMEVPHTIEEATDMAVQHGDLTIKEAEQANQSYHEIFG